MCGVGSFELLAADSGSYVVVDWQLWVLFDESLVLTLTVVVVVWLLYAVVRYVQLMRYSVVVAAVVVVVVVVVVVGVVVDMAFVGIVDVGCILDCCLLRSFVGCCCCCCCSVLARFVVDDSVGLRIRETSSCVCFRRFQTWLWSSVFVDAFASCAFCCRCYYCCCCCSI